MRARRYRQRLVSTLRGGYPGLGPIQSRDEGPRSFFLKKISAIEPQNSDVVRNYALPVTPK
jgi:hypothetical protein